MHPTSPHATAARTEKRAAAEAIGINPDFINLLVERFYARVRDDARLGPIFDARITDWPHHLARMKAFWGSVLHESGGFSGNPMVKHVAIPSIEAAEFEHWLTLFDETLRAIERDPAATGLINDRARMIADSLLTGIRIHRDGKLGTGSLRGTGHAG